MLENLQRRGYQPGGGLMSPSGVFYLNIPKNASTYITNVLRHNGWEYFNIKDRHRIQKCVVVLRDPVDRWISGFATYASSWLLGEGYGSDHFLQDYNPLVERLIFDNLTFDDHTTAQSTYVEQVSDLPTTYFKLNKNIINDLGQDLNINLTIEPVDDNKSENNYDQQQISTLIANKVESDPVLKARIFEHFKSDFDLINRVKFYYEPR